MRFMTAMRTHGALAAMLFSAAMMARGAHAHEDARITFDLPDAIECRDVTPPEFVAAHSSLKVIEAKFRISARVERGDLADVVDFLYVVSNADRTMRVQDFLPNTTLESAVAGDQIEITNGSENADTLGAQAHVAYKVLATTGTASHSVKNTHTSHYKELAAKDLVVASGTTDREHGVFFRLRPSRLASLEGAKEFTFLATVPATWRGDVCLMTCAARARKSSLFSKAIEPAGEARARVAMYLRGDSDAASLADAFRRAQEHRLATMRGLPPKENVLDSISHQTVGFFTHKSPERRGQQDFEAATAEVAAIQARLKELSR